MDQESLARLLFETDWPTDKWENHNRSGQPDAAARRYLMLGEAVCNQIQKDNTEKRERDLDLLNYAVDYGRRHTHADLIESGLYYDTYDAEDVLDKFNVHWETRNEE